MARLQMEAPDDIERVAMLEDDQQRLIQLVAELRGEARDADDALLAELGPRPPDERSKPSD